VEIVPAPLPAPTPVLFGALGHVFLKGETLELSGVRGEIGTERTLLVALPHGARPAKAVLNGRPVRMALEKDVATIIADFAGQAFGRGHSLAAYDPAFAGGTVKGRFVIPARVFEQLRKNKDSWPVAYTEDDLKATWLGIHRLLLFVQIAEPDEAVRAALKIDGTPVALIKAYNSIYGHEPKRTFLGVYADVPRLDAGREHAFELTLPALAPGRFQGLFFENVEPEFTAEIRTESR
jgi:hypothetical protein